MRCLLVILCLLTPPWVSAQVLVEGVGLTVRELSVPDAGGTVRVRCYSTQNEVAQPVVVLLHGALGFSRFARHYENYAQALAPRGLRVCAILYYSASDNRVMDGRDQDKRSNLFRRRFMAWHDTVSRVADHLSKLPTTARGTIGILGFSQGAYLAVGVAGTNPKVQALAAFYGGFPFPLETRITRLPPTLILHGESDAVIPVQEAHALEAAARMRTQSVVMKLYPGAAHGFDVQSEAPNAVDARMRTVDFFVRHLLK